jgi:hypothetical protein
MSSSTPPDFDDLARELDLWAGEGRVAAFWWRDDDAAKPIPALAQLLDLSDAHRIEVALAVVPAMASDTLVSALDARAHVSVLQHGYAHKNHARAGEPAVECGGDRPVEEVLEELARGRRRLEEMLGARFEPILAAPWNRIERRVLDRLSEAGFRGASAYGPRAAMRGAHGLAIANAHVDPVNWRERRFAGRGKALSGIIGELRARRNGESEMDEPLGLLTHHLDHDADLWAFLPDFFRATAAHPAARWINVAEAFAAAPAKPAARLGVR